MDDECVQALNISVFDELLSHDREVVAQPLLLRNRLLEEPGVLDRHHHLGGHEQAQAHLFGREMASLFCRIQADRADDLAVDDQRDDQDGLDAPQPDDVANSDEENPEAAAVAFGDKVGKVVEEIVRISQDPGAGYLILRRVVVRMPIRSDVTEQEDYHQATVELHYGPTQG